MRSGTLVFTVLPRNRSTGIPTKGSAHGPVAQRFNDAMHGEQSAPGAGIPIFSTAQSNTDGSNSHISQPEWLRAASEPGDRRVGSGVRSHERSKRVSIQFDVMSRSDSWENIARFARDPERAGVSGMLFT